MNSNEEKAFCATIVICDVIVRTKRCWCFRMLPFRSIIMQIPGNDTFDVNDSGGESGNSYATNDFFR